MVTSPSEGFRRIPKELRQLGGEILDFCKERTSKDAKIMVYIKDPKHDQPIMATDMSKPQVVALVTSLLHAVNEGNIDIEHHDTPE